LTYMMDRKRTLLMTNRSHPSYSQLIHWSHYVMYISKFYFF